MYEKILMEIDNEDIDIISIPLSDKIKGLYADNVIAINKSVTTEAEKTCILAEELGHHHTSSGNILDQSKITNRKQELRARRWAVKKLITLNSLIAAYEAGVRNRHELSEYLGVTEEFIDTALEHFKGIYGYSHSVGKYSIIFSPLVVVKRVE